VVGLGAKRRYGADPGGWVWVFGPLTCGCTTPCERSMACMLGSPAALMAAQLCLLPVDAFTPACAAVHGQSSCPAGTQVSLP
jgi:hypothetical protein